MLQSNKSLIHINVAWEMTDGSDKREIEEGLVLRVKYDSSGLAPAVVQDVDSGDILMLAYVNEEALRETIRTRRATFWTRSRQKLWTKGEESGNYLEVEEVRVDCDQDALIYRVKMLGKGACHTQNKDKSPRRSCFYRRMGGDGQGLEFISK